MEEQVRVTNAFQLARKLWVQCQARTRQKMSQGKAQTSGPKCPVLGGIQLGTDLEQLLGQVILEEGATCLLYTQGKWLTLSPGPPQHQVTSKGGGDVHRKLGAINAVNVPWLRL